MRFILRSLFLAMLAAVVLAVGGCQPSVEPSASAAAGAREFSVQGMSCEGCVESVTACLKKVLGVQSAQVSLAEKKAVIVADPVQVPDEKIVAAVKEAGYQAEPRSAAPPAR